MLPSAPSGATRSPDPGLLPRNTGSQLGQSPGAAAAVALWRDGVAAPCSSCASALRAPARATPSTPSLRPCRGSSPPPGAVNWQGDPAAGLWSEAGQGSMQGAGVTGPDSSGVGSSGGGGWGERIWGDEES